MKFFLRSLPVPLLEFVKCVKKLKFYWFVWIFPHEMESPDGLLTSVRLPESDAWHSYMRMNVHSIMLYWDMVDALSNPIIECVVKYIFINILR